MPPLPIPLPTHPPTLRCCGRELIRHAGRGQRVDVQGGALSQQRLQVIHVHAPGGRRVEGLGFRGARRVLLFRTSPTHCARACSRPRHCSGPAPGPGAQQARSQSAGKPTPARHGVVCAGGGHPTCQPPPPLGPGPCCAMSAWVCRTCRPRTWPPGCPGRAPPRPRTPCRRGCAAPGASGGLVCRGQAGRAGAARVERSQGKGGAQGRVLMQGGRGGGLVEGAHARGPWG